VIEQCKSHQIVCRITDTDEAVLGMANSYMADNMLATRSAKNCVYAVTDG
jgi:hypothetical protein